MALDAQFLGILTKELDCRLCAARVERIFMPSKDEAVIDLHTQDGAARLLLCARSGSARAHITRADYERPDAPSSFCMLLRKYIGRGRIKAVRAVEGERVILFEFSSVADTGDLMDITLSVEMMGRYSNIVVVRDGRVVDALKRITIEQSELRQLLPNVLFTLPPAQNKAVFSNTPPERLAQLARQEDCPLPQALLNVAAGVSPVVCREIAYRSASIPLERAIASVQDERKLCIAYDGDKAAEFSFVELSQYGDARLKFFDSPSALLEEFFCEKDADERKKSRSRDLAKQIGRLIARVARKRDARLLQRGDSSGAEQKKLYGELVTANLHADAASRDSITVDNYYTGEAVSIPLDPRLSLAANAQKYYKEYRKLTTAANMLDELLETDERELAYLRSVAYAVSECSTEQELELIRQELKTAGYLRNYKPKDKKPKLPPHLSYKTPEGFSIMAGRNNLQNDAITHKLADKNDYWFHVKDYAGSHVVLVCRGEEPPQEAIAAAANIAAVRSEAGGTSVAVDYTKVKNVRRQPCGRPGMVYYRSFNTIYVAPKTEEEEKLRCGK